MSRTILSGLIQARNPINDESKSVAEVQAAMLEKHLPMIHDAGKKGVQILCLQEIFNGPYFCPGQDKRWYDAAEAVPGPTVEKLAPLAAKYKMVMVVPLYERESAGVYYNTAAVIDADGSYLGKYRKTHIPQTSRDSGRSTSSGPATSAIRRSRPSMRRSASTSATTATSPRGRARSGLNGAEIVYNPSATVAGLSQYLWKLEQPAHAVANGYFVGAINRVGTEAPWNIGKFYGNSYFVIRAARSSRARARTKTSSSPRHSTWT